MNCHALAVVLFVCLIGATMTTYGAEPNSAWPHDVDHPTRFDPTFKDQAAWEARADALRTQTLVAAGLWPMPEKTPLNVNCTSS